MSGIINNRDTTVCIGDKMYELHRCYSMQDIQVIDEKVYESIKKNHGIKDNDRVIIMELEEMDNPDNKVLYIIKNPVPARMNGHREDCMTEFDITFRCQPIENSNISGLAQNLLENCMEIMETRKQNTTRSYI